MTIEYTADELVMAQNMIALGIDPHAHLLRMVAARISRDAEAAYHGAYDHYAAAMRNRDGSIDSTCTEVAEQPKLT